MDEVDGMAGNEDRGGMQVRKSGLGTANKHQKNRPDITFTVFEFEFEFEFKNHLLSYHQELILLIKNTKIPVICMCNDRNSQKIRSLANYCFDLRFQRPRVEQIKVNLTNLNFTLTISNFLVMKKTAYIKNAHQM